MYTVFVVLVLLASILMCFIVLIQNSKGGGLASTFASSNQIMGVRKTTDFLEKGTWVLAIFMAVFSVCASLTISNDSVIESSVLQKDAVENIEVNPNIIPDQSLTVPVEETVPAE